VDFYAAKIISLINGFPINEAKHYYEHVRTEMDHRIHQLRLSVADNILPKRDPPVILNLSRTLLDYYSLYGNLSLLDESVSLLRAVLAEDGIRQNHPIHEDTLDVLGEALSTRYEHTTDINDAIEAISLHRESLDLRKAYGLPLYPSLHGLGVSIYVKEYGDIPHPSFPMQKFELASEHLKQALACLPQSDHRRPKTLSYLQRVFREMGRPDNSYLASYRVAYEALVLTPTDHPYHLLAVLAGARVLSIPWGTCKGTLIRYEGASYDESVQAVAYVSDLMAHIHHPHYGSSLSRLVTWVSNAPETLSFDDVLSQARRAFDICPKRSIPAYNVSIALIAALGDAYLVTGNLSYVDEQILVARTAIVESRRPGRSLFRPLIYNLAQGLYNRYKYSGLVEDLEESVSLLDECVKPIIGSPRRGDCEMLYMHFAGTLRIARFEHFGDLSDLEIALELGRRCIPAVPDNNPEVYISVVALALELRFRHTRDITDLREAIDLLRSRLPRLALYSVVFRLDIVNSLSRCLCLLASVLEQPDYAREALALRKDAFQYIPSNQPRLGEYIRGFAHEHACLWELLQDRDHLSECMRHFSEGASNTSIPPHSRLACAIEWSRACTDADPEVRSDAFRCAVTLLPQVILFGDLRARLAALKQAPGVARDAAIHELARSRTDLAVELLEQGRAVFWNRALSSRQREDSLPQEISGRLADIWRNIEFEASKDDRSLTRRKQLIQEYEALLEEARSTPGFEHLLRTRSLRELSAVARGGPVVVLLANEMCAIALIIQAGETPYHLILPEVNSRVLENLSDALHISLDSERRSRFPQGPQRKFRKRRAQRLHQGKSKRLSCTKVLEVLWTNIVHPVLKRIGLKVQQLTICVDLRGLIKPRTGRST
jgi:tetratricopeptide (TPR) repeat protein